MTVNLTINDQLLQAREGQTLIEIARENHIPILVFSIQEHGAFADVLAGRGKFTIITDKD